MEFGCFEGAPGQMNEETKDVGSKDLLGDLMGVRMVTLES